MVSNFIDRLLTILFPKTEDEIKIHELRLHDLVVKLHPEEISGVTALFSYRDPVIRALVWQTKYRNDRHAVTLLGDVLAHHIKTLDCSDAILVPIPLSNARARERGYNQAERITSAAGAALKMSVDPLALSRRGNPLPQTTLTKRERIENLKDVFEAHEARVRGKHILLIDDVTTTGTTLKEARRALEKAGAASVISIAIAH